MQNAKCSMNITIVIPARYGSTRFPGKPLAKIGDKTMLSRVVEIAGEAAQKFRDVSVLVTTEDQGIAAHAAEIDVPCIMTPAECPTGSDRVLAALRKLDEKPDFVLNLQGDAPFTPPEALHALIDEFQDDPALEVVTPVYQLSWKELDRLREAKKTTPFSGTTAIVNEQSEALWFSKNIIPAIRKEEELREEAALSPVHQHLGLYGFRSDVLEKFCALPQGMYEQLEGLEQLRMLENGIKIRAVKIELAGKRSILSGIDTPEDLERAERLLETANEHE